tara:strand:- start:893 stop:1072 length:180 start_codon:yes stop_codon:yes gene_type:complete
MPKPLFFLNHKPNTAQSKQAVKRLDCAGRAWIKIILSCANRNQSRLCKNKQRILSRPQA